MTTQRITQANDTLFQLISVSFLPLGTSEHPSATTRVDWVINPNLCPNASFNFQLQVSHSGLDDVADADDAATDWKDVFGSSAGEFWATDDEQRVWGSAPDVYYRIRVTGVGSDVRYSHVVPVTFSGPSWRDWRIQRKILLQESKRNKYTAVTGWLLRERRYGKPCKHCRMYGTDEPRSMECEVCFGVGIEKGYFAGMAGLACEFVQLPNVRERQDHEQRGTVREETVQGRFSLAPLLNSRDLFVADQSGQRWSIEQVTHVARVRGFMLVQKAEMRLIPYTSQLYHVPLEAVEEGA